MRNNIFVVLIGYGITITWIASELVKENTQLTYDINVSQTAFMIQSSNINRVMKENKSLRQANDCLIKYKCTIAIKRTPLPPLIKVK